jgi:hypothetical protein
LVMASRSVDQSTFLEDDFTATCGGDHHQWRNLSGDRVEVYCSGKKRG